MTRPSRRAARLMLAFVLGTLAAGVAIDAAAAAFLDVDWRDIVRVVRGAGAAAPVALIVLMVIAVVVPPIPSVPLDIAAGVVFGVTWGVVWVLVGAEIGAVISFLLARRLGRGWVERRIDPDALARIDDIVERRGVVALFGMRLVPTFHFDLVSYAAGLTSMRLVPFAAATLAGMAPPVIAIVTVGDQIDSSPILALSIFGALLAIVLVPLAWWSIVDDAP